MLQQTAKSPLPVFFEKGVLSRRLGYGTTPRTATANFRDGAITVRTASIREVHNAIVTLHHRSDAGQRVCVSLGTWHDHKTLSFNGCINIDELDGLVAVIKEIKENLERLKPETEQSNH
jgi:hypothetical protein